MSNSSGGGIMAHNLNIVNGKANAVFTGSRESVWHRLGIYVDSAMSMDEVIRLANMGFTVEKKQLRGPDGESIESWGIFRNDTNAFLGTVGERYTPHQISLAFRTVDTLLEDIGGSHY